MQLDAIEGERRRVTKVVWDKRAKSGLMEAPRRLRLTRVQCRDPQENVTLVLLVARGRRVRLAGRS